MDLPEDGSHPPGAKLFAIAKSNIGPNHGGFYYYLDVVKIDGQEGQTTTRWRWGEYLPGKARDLIASAEGEDVTNKMTMVISWLRNMFSDRKTIPAKEVKDAMEAKGVKSGTLKNAKKRLKIDSEKYANGWVWIWPDEQEAAKNQNSDSSNMSNDIEDIDDVHKTKVNSGDSSTKSNENGSLGGTENSKVKSQSIFTKSQDEPEWDDDDFVVFHSKNQN